jgi:ComF family protein
MSTAVNRILAAQVDGWLARVGRAVCPPRCLVCREPGAAGQDLCAACTIALFWNRHACTRCALPLAGEKSSPSEQAVPVCGACLRRPPPLHAVHAAFVYAFPVDRLLPRFKFHRDLAAGRLLVQRMAEAFAPLPRPDALLPVPLHRGRLRARGYDQALELARPLGRRLDLPVLEDALVRQRATVQQSRLDARQRQRNLRGAFALSHANALPAHVALVDDVMTTGATLHAAAAALRRAGVLRVDAWVAARAP